MLKFVNSNYKVVVMMDIFRVGGDNVKHCSSVFGIILCGSCEEHFIHFVEYRTVCSPDGLRSVVWNLWFLHSVVTAVYDTGYM